MSKQRTYLLIGAAVSGILVLVTAGITATGINKATALRDEMKSSYSKLENFFKKNPFPSAENVATEEKNLDLLKERYATLMKELSKNEVVVKGVHTPGSFSKTCEETVNALRKDAPQGAGDASVIVPGFNFGFQRYDISKEGKPADQKNVSRLLCQLRMTDMLVRFFYDAGILKLDSVLREEFDAASDDTGASRGRGRVGRGRSASSSSSDVTLDKIEEEPILDAPFALDRQRFGFVFLAKESALFSLMDKINSMWPFAQISNFEFIKNGKDVIFPLSAGEVAAATEVAGIIKPPAGVTTRIVSGALREAPVKVIMTIDIYTFGAEKDEEPE